MLYTTQVTKNILLVEDNLADIRLIREAIAETTDNIKLHVVTDGVQAIDYLSCKNTSYVTDLPDLILLDLNLPKKNGKEVLKSIKTNENLKNIPVVILTLSQSEDDISECYRLHANAYVIKPIELERFFEVFKNLLHYWFNVTTLPPRKLCKDI